MAAILHVIDTTGPGGAETVFIELADRLRQRGHRSVVLIRGPGWVADELMRRKLEPIVIPAKGSFNLSLLAGIVSLIRRHDIDLIQSHLLGSNIYAALAGIISRRPVVATFHGVVDVAEDERFRRLKLAALDYGVSRFVTVSDDLAAAISSAGLLRRERCEVIYNGVDLDVYARGGQPENDLKRRLGLEQNVRLAGCVGNLRSAKAYDVLVAALAEVADKVPDFHIAIAGQGSASAVAALTQLADRAGVAERLHITGFCDDVPGFLRALDLFLLPSRSEGFSIATVEALAAGLPVIATRCGGPEEILEDGSSGWLVATEDAGALAQKMTAVLNGQDLYAGLSREAIAAAAARYNIDTMVARYESLYLSLLNDGV